MHPWVRKFGGEPLRWSARRMAAAFDRACDDGVATQSRVLDGLLALNVESDFSRRHGLRPGMGITAFRQSVPIADYEAYRPWIERLKTGDLSALLGRRNRLLMFTLSSGTTSEAKFVPITDRFLADYRRGWKVWGIRAFDAHPGVHRGDILQLGSDHDQFRTAAGHPCGNISGLVAAMQCPLLKRMYAVPDLVAKLKDADAKSYSTLRYVLGNSGVGVILTANPSTLVQLSRRATEWSESLLRDLHNGTLTPPGQIPDPLRSGLTRLARRPNPSRARELQRLLDRHGRLPLEQAWPGLSLIGVWTGGSAGAYLPALRREFAGVPVRDHGLSASEGRMTIPFADDSSAGVLDIVSNFFEFIPEEEYESPHRTTLLAHELEPGRNYYILLTTPSGLWRYDIRDVVRCHGFHRRAPLLEFLHKGAHMASMTGEKLAESQVVRAVRSVVEALDLKLSHFTLCPVFADPAASQGPGYRLIVERRDLPAGFDASGFCTQLDEALQRENPEYADKRHSSRLAPVTLTPVPDGSWSRFARSRQGRVGGSVEQYKHPCLVGSLTFHAEFLERFATTG
jgi:hypothetical protein